MVATGRLARKNQDSTISCCQKTATIARSFRSWPPQGDEITILKTTDSALTGTNLRLILHNLGVKEVIVAGIFTDQCVSSTVRSLADESFGVIVVEDCCSAGTEAIHNSELEIINMIYCHVVQLTDLQDFIS